MIKAQQVVLSSRPHGPMTPQNFSMLEIPLPDLKAGEFLIRNKILSLDAGFRQWMNAGASDNYLPEMPLMAPVQSIVLGEIVESLHPAYPTGSHIVGRTAWETYSIADGSDLMTIVDLSNGIAPEQYLSALGPSGMTAYFGLLKIGLPRPGDTVVVSAAAGGVGSLVGQLAKIQGCRTVGISSSEEKCRWLISELGYDIAVNYRKGPPLAQQLRDAAPDGINIYFDNVGGEMLDVALTQLAMNSRVVLCGAISQYESDEHSGIRNMWELITKRARAEGFMFSDYIDEYDEASMQLAQWIAAGQLKAPLNLSHGIGSTAKAFCDMLSGDSRGKCLVVLEA